MANATATSTVTTSGSHVDRFCYNRFILVPIVVLFQVILYLRWSNSNITQITTGKIDFQSQTDTGGNITTIGVANWGLSVLGDDGDLVSTDGTLTARTDGDGKIIADAKNYDGRKGLRGIVEDAVSPSEDSSVTNMSLNHSVVDGEPSSTSLTNSSEAVEVAPPQRFPVDDENFNGNNSMAMCTMWMDDNHKMKEWIAYNYYALPMRYLVMFKDPSSLQNLTTVLDRWKDLITVVEWDKVPSEYMTPEDEKFQESYLQIKHEPSSNSSVSKEMWVKMQQLFLRACARHLQSVGRTWTLNVDTDEYVAIISQARNTTDDVMGQPGAVMKVLQAERLDNTSRWYQRDCFTLARFDISAIESPIEEREYNVPSFLDACRYETVRFRHRGRMGYGKPLADVTKIDASKISSHHTYVKNECGGHGFGHHKDPMNVQHYLGAWENYISRANDVRGYDFRRKQWMERANFTTTYKQYKKEGERLKYAFVGDRLRPWLQGFVDYVGKERAIALIGDSGFPCNATTALRTISYPIAK